MVVVLAIIAAAILVEPTAAVLADNKMIKEMSAGKRVNCTVIKQNYICTIIIIR